MIGVLQFPGSCDERDAVAACERVGETRLVWHEETDLSGIDAIVAAAWELKDAEPHRSPSPFNSMS